MDKYYLDILLAVWNTYAITLVSKVNDNKKYRRIPGNFWFMKEIFNILRNHDMIDDYGLDSNLSEK